MSTSIPIAMAAASAVQSAQAQKSAAQKVNRDYDANMANILRQQKMDAKYRQDELAKASATQRARFGALGIGSAEGSSAAVLDGLETKTAEELRNDASAYAYKIDKLNNSYADMRADLLADNNDTVAQLARWY